MLKAKQLIVIAYALAASASAVQADVYIRDNGGGSVLRFAAAVATLNSNGGSARIGGVCGSACTLYLSAKRYCVEHDARLVFHAARFEGNQKAAQLFTRYLFSKYPPKVKAWVTRNGGLTARTITLKGAALRANVRICK